jgi:hypothetical protein
MFWGHNFKQTLEATFCEYGNKLSVSIKIEKYNDLLISSWRNEKVKNFQIF